MAIKNTDLVEEMISILTRSENAVKQFKKLSIEQLNHRKSPDSWSILECIEHLNLYADFYIPEIQQRIKAYHQTNNNTFKPGWLGNYFANMMKSKAGKIKKMKSPKDKNPINSQLTMSTLDKFIAQQVELKQLLFKSQHLDLTKIKTSISLSTFIKLRLGDTFRFLIYHVERHIQQAERLVG